MTQTVFPAQAMKKMLFLVLLSAFSCQKEEATAEEAEMTRLKTQIDALTADKTCGAERSCGVIGLGSKPCGGPWSYLIYSLNAADAVALADMVKRYNQLEAERNRRENRVSDCMMVLPPEVACTDGKCQSL